MGSKDNAREQAPYDSELRYTHLRQPEFTYAQFTLKERFAALSEEGKEKFKRELKRDIERRKKYMENIPVLRLW